MSLLRSILRLGVTGAVVVTTSLAAAPAHAQPPSAHLDGVYTCTNGSSYAVYVTDGNAPVGFIDGKAVVARAFQFHDAGTLTVTGGTYAGDVIAFNVAAGPTRNHGPLVKAASLKDTVTCSQTFSGPVPAGTLSADDVAFLGIDPKYVGSPVTGNETATITVYIGAEQLAHR